MEGYVCLGLGIVHFCWPVMTFCGRGMHSAECPLVYSVLHVCFCVTAADMLS